MKRLSTVLLALALALVMVLPASATVYQLYTPYYFQQGGTPYADHIVPRKWQNFQWFGKPDTEVLWWQDPTYLGTDTIFLENALNGWVYNIDRSELGFKKGASNNWDLLLELDNPKICSTHWGCIVVSSWSLNNTTKVHTWHKIRVKLGLNILDLDGPAYAAAHYNVIAQTLGLMSMYNGGWACNPDHTSVMDGVNTAANPDVPCDTGTPNAWDQANARTFWGRQQGLQGYIFNGAGTSGPNQEIVWQAWTDKYWSEFEHRTQWYYTTNNGSTWIWFAAVTNYTDIGTHYDIAQRSIQVNVTPASYGVSKSAATHVMACAEAYYTPTRWHGWHCGGMVAW